jgi:hypothetical protein
VVDDDEPVQVEQSPGFLPWRRRVRWLQKDEAPIRPLIPRLAFIDNKQAWGAKFRFGFLEIPLDDARLLAREMGVLAGPAPEDRGGSRVRGDALTFGLVY